MGLGRIGFAKVPECRRNIEPLLYGIGFTDASFRCAVPRPAAYVSSE